MDDTSRSIVSATPQTESKSNQYKEIRNILVAAEKGKKGAARELSSVGYTLDPTLSRRNYKVFTDTEGRYNVAFRKGANTGNIAKAMFNPVGKSLIGQGIKDKRVTQAKHIVHKLQTMRGPVNVYGQGYGGTLAEKSNAKGNIVTYNKFGVPWMGQGTKKNQTDIRTQSDYQSMFRVKGGKGQTIELPNTYTLDARKASSLRALGKEGMQADWTSGLARGIHTITNQLPLEILDTRYILKNPELAAAAVAGMVIAPGAMTGLREIVGGATAAEEAATVAGSVSRSGVLDSLLELKEGIKTIQNASKMNTWKKFALAEVNTLADEYTGTTEEERNAIVSGARALQNPKKVGMSQLNQLADEYTGTSTVQRSDMMKKVQRKKK